MIDIYVDKADMRAFRDTIKKAEFFLGKTTEQALRWGAVNLMISLAAITKKSSKLRPIVKNPHPKATTDGRRGKFGVNRWKPATSEKYFQPIYRTGEFGKYRFFEKNGMWFKKPTRAGNEPWEKIEGIPDSGEDEKLPSIEKSKKRIIGRSGLAKKAWKWAQVHMIRGGTGAPMPGVPNLMEVKVWGKGADSAIRIDNGLRYAESALTGGASRISEVMGRAARSMEHKINQQLQKKYAK